MRQYPSLLEECDRMSLTAPDIQNRFYRKAFNQEPPKVWAKCIEVSEAKVATQIWPLWIYCRNS